MTETSLGWLGIIRLGLVQTAIGAIAVLTTTTINRVMIVEMALPASLPAALVAWHYVVQLSRPRWGHGSDAGRNRTPWIIYGMGVLALGAILAADATVTMATAPVEGIALGLIAFAMIGGGVAASGTSLLALLATRVPAARRPAAAAIAWVMMIVGIVLTAGIAGQLLDPYSAQRLVLVATGIAGIAFGLTLLAVRGMEAAPAVTAAAVAQREPDAGFRASLRRVWQDPLARDFTLFVFVSMLAYSAEELILEPYAGLVFGYSLGKSTGLAGLQHGGVLIGMIALGLTGTLLKGDRTNFLKRSTMVGCAASALALAGLAALGLGVIHTSLEPVILALGFANGLFAVSALGLMMSFAGGGSGAREGIRVGLWGAAQAGAFALGGFIGATGLDLMRHAIVSVPVSFAAIFGIESLCFIAAAVIALRFDRRTVVAMPSVGGLIQSQA